jgi:hypothetical protein
MLGLSIPLMNIWYTKKTVTDEDNQRRALKLLGQQTQRLKPLPA